MDLAVATANNVSIFLSLLNPSLDSSSVLVSATVVGSITLTANPPSPIILSQGGSPVAVTDGTVDVTAPTGVAYTVKIRSANASGAAPLASIANSANQIPALSWDGVLPGISGWGIKVTAGPTPIAGQVGFGNTAITNADLTFYTNTGDDMAQTANLSFKAAASSSQAVANDYKTTIYYTAFPS
jgi:hypothetical protein